MYWGRPDISVSFCEDKYKENKYIAEYYNTISAISYLLVGLFFYKTKIKSLGLIIIMLGIGTILLHGTLRYYGQWLDELSMLSLSFNIIKKLRLEKLKKHTSNLYLIALLGNYFIFEKYFYYFVIIFLCLQIYIYLLGRRLRSYTIKKYILIKLYSIVFFLSTFCWLLDQFFCDYVKKYQLHAIWHVGTALSMLLGLSVFLI